MYGFEIPGRSGRSELDIHCKGGSCDGGITATKHIWLWLSLQVITISGRTIRKEAQASPDRATIAIAQINSLIAKLPDPLVEKAEAIRKQRRQQLARS